VPRNRFLIHRKSSYRGESKFRWTITLVYTWRTPANCALRERRDAKGRPPLRATPLHVDFLAFSEGGAM